MTPTPPSTTGSSNASRSPEPQFRVVRKRNRIPLSCYPCRTRKKCDRSHPCGNCTRREGPDTLSCTYATPISRRKPSNQDPSPDDMQNRIDRLEGLVLSLMHGGINIEAISHGASSTTSSGGAASNTSPSGADGNAAAKSDGHEEADFDEDESEVDEDLAKSLGVLKVDSDRSKQVYFGDQNWHTILKDIAEVRNYFATHKNDLEKSYERIKQSKHTTCKQPPTLLMGATPATEDELRARLPPKSTVMALCQRYFSSMDNSGVLLHVPTFYQQLHDHWNDPSRTPIMWLALLYSVLSLAMLSYHKIGDEPLEWKGRALELSNEYRLRTVQCLIAGEYTKAPQYTVEAMVLYACCEYSSRWDADSSIWVIVAMVVRIALRMGYHRDGKWFPNLTPFEAEMRRRTWAVVTMLDTFFSHRVSLPTMISDDECDTDLPHNLYDEDFGPQSSSLPPDRPNAEPTPVSYTVAKVKLCQQLRQVLRTTGRLKNQAHYDEILRLDAGLRDIKAGLPPHLRLQPLDQSQAAPTMIMAQFNLDILYLKIMCMLHRKYMCRGRHNPRYAHSRRSAIEASMEMLRHLANIYRESMPNGRLHSIRYFFTNVATKDFLLPAMLVLLTLHFDSTDKAAQGQQQDSQATHFWTREQRREMFSRLELTRDIWKGLADSSIDALKASNILDIMLAKMKGSENPDAAIKSSPESSGHERNFTNLGSNTTCSSALPPPISSGTAASLSGPVSLFDGPEVPTDFPSVGVNLEPTANGGGQAAEAIAGGISGLEFSNPVLNLGSGQSPLNILDSMGVGNMDLPGSFDWESLENYAQTANWGGESLQFFPGQADFVYDTGVQDGAQYTYGIDLTGTN